MTLSQYLDSTGTTQRELAARLGVEPATVWRWIAGVRHPRPTMLRRIAEVTDGAVQPGDFFQTPPQLRAEVIGA